MAIILEKSGDQHRINLEKGEFFFLRRDSHQSRLEQRWLFQANVWKTCRP